jgi:hypothetical protein
MNNIIAYLSFLCILNIDLDNSVALLRLNYHADGNEAVLRSQIAALKHAKSTIIGSDRAINVLHIQ